MSSSSSALTRRRLLAGAGAIGAAAATGVLRAGAVWATTGPGSYTASWPSVDQHPAAPEWFQDAKFGIYFQVQVDGRDQLVRERAEEQAQRAVCGP